MRTPSFPLRTLLRSLVLASGPVGLLACSARLAPTPMSETIPCTPLDAARYASITPAPGIDGIAFFTRGFDHSGELTARQTLASSGAPCSTARDRAACLARVDEPHEGSGWYVIDRGGVGAFGPSGIDYGVITAGDDVRLIATTEELRVAVAPIESFEEAVAFATVTNVGFTCGQPTARIEPDDTVLFQRISRSCSGQEVELLTKMTRDGRTTVDTRELHEKDNGCIEGRRPAGLASRAEPWLASLPAHFAAIAHMEAAAVIAFAELERELARVSAPEELRARVSKARVDEIEHAARMTALSRRYGREPARPDVVARGGQPTILQLAIDNATEGCVREAYGALVATHQATFATDPAVRTAFDRIAADETEHAELSFDLGVWLAAMLSPREVALVASAQDAAWEDVAKACSVEVAGEVALSAGMPTAAAARQLLAGLRRHAPRFGQAHPTATAA